MPRRCHVRNIACCKQKRPYLPIMNNIQGKRIGLKRKVPNPIFQTWLEELLEEAKAKKSKLEPILQEALNSISKYPLTLPTGADCAILKGFDKKLCKFLDKRLKIFKENRSNCVNVEDTASTTSQSSSSQSLETNQNRNSSENPVPSSSSGSGPNSQKSPKKSKCRKYKPLFRSGGYAILITLLEKHDKDSDSAFMTKAELIDKAQKHTEESFTRAKPDSFYTVWSNMGKLVTKGLVTKVRKQNFCKYALTEEGISLAKELIEDYKNTPTANDIIFRGAMPSSNSITSNDNPSTLNEYLNTEVHETREIQRTTSQVSFVNLQPGSFDIILLIDKCETSGLSNKNDPTVAQFNKYPDLKHEYRSLKIGDFTWIARHKTNKDQELVLPYVVERKRMDDLGASIKDGRFHEQKFRLRKCGLKNVFYLVEHYGQNKHVGLPVQSLMQALANTRVQDNFKVHITDSLTDSSRFLAMLTKRLTIEYQDQHLLGCNKESEGEELMTFNFFNKSSMKSKPLTITETFIKLLLQLKGVSVEKALAITNVYSTPRYLMKEYEGHTQKEGEFLLSNIKFGALNRNIGPNISKSIYQLFNRDE